MIIAAGTAEPPISVRLRVENRRPWAPRWLSIASQTVGTPAAIVTRSASIISYTDLPSSAGPGITSFAPAMGAP